MMNGFESKALRIDEPLMGKVKCINLQMPLDEYDRLVKAIGAYQYESGDAISRSEYIRMAIREAMDRDLGSMPEDDLSTEQTKLEEFDRRP